MEKYFINQLPVKEGPKSKNGMVEIPMLSFSFGTIDEVISVEGMEDGTTYILEDGRAQALVIHEPIAKEIVIYKLFLCSADEVIAEVSDQANWIKAGMELTAEEVFNHFAEKLFTRVVSRNDKPTP